MTHALIMTKLTSESGKVLGESALDLVDKVDTVAGQILGVRGDKQFRIYVQLKPRSLELLNQSKEFKREADNTVYHKGFPICFRSTAGTPSLQISLTRDAARADIDVDYRSSKFPVGLVNGHLTASNSDIRAGDNDTRHDSQWAGVQNWWRNLLGLPLTDTAKPVKGGPVLVATEPKLKGAKPADAIYEFFNSWLVEQKPNEAVPNFAEEAFACMEVEKGSKIDRGMAKYAMLQGMMAVNKQLGKISSLSEATVGVTIKDDRLKLIEQSHNSQFVLYDVREDVAEAFNCVNKLDSTQISAKAMKSRSFGKYVGAVLRIKTKDQAEGRTLASIWRKENEYWKLISYDVDPELGASRTPNAGTQVVTAAPLDYVEGDKDMIKAASDFLKQWMVRKNIDKALEYVAPECLACINLYRADDVPAASTAEEQRERLKKGMARAAESIGTVKNLDEALSAPEPHHQDLKLVKHRDDESFVIVSVPEYMGEAADCKRRKPDGGPEFRNVSAKGYGKYYAAGFTLSSGTTEPGTLWLLWSKINGSWRLSSYALLTP